MGGAESSEDADRETVGGAHDAAHIRREPSHRQVAAFVTAVSLDPGDGRRRAPGVYVTACAAWLPHGWGGDPAEG